ncbi:uncharacterized protein MYCFIDRAFT_89639 [Pseudocercospora fijiensis CIRAD86]|uniref:Myb-like domain-containing protein n=1 Tax=Pseudocercospora fijiensis (strain CIRAD86) TaxID=383855 RepID=N1QCC4_PSEFD|nr:uncharacterized protein MYCFIDRAFT_89639 [Pseudocercospora fijiensis CIRAD86]EME89058.1 hypothetical protein MYCFIDRAFT_89639 [Pseudocercospora fijiensis CIRAD86]
MHFGMVLASTDDHCAVHRLSVKETMANTTSTNHPQGRMMPQNLFYNRRPPQHRTRQFQAQPHLRLRTMAVHHQRPRLDMGEHGLGLSQLASGASSFAPEACNTPRSAAIEEARLRRDRDKYLLKMRERGLSYKEIKRRGKFKEAESTLRGRIRVLTKDKSERVRRPDWTENDLQLLEHAVSHFERFDGTVRGREVHSRVPWKKISDWMRSRGSSYTFAPATCAKKYRELHSL